MEVMGRDAGWLTGTAVFGGADLYLIPEFEITAERKEFFLETVKEAYLKSSKKTLIIAVSEGVRWYDDKLGKVDVVYASPEVDEYGHPRFGGISGIIASEIYNKLHIDARAIITGYYPRSGNCSEYDRRLTMTLADKVVDLILREDYGQMPVMTKIVPYDHLEEFNTGSIDMGKVGNRSLPDEYYDVNRFQFTEGYTEFLGNILQRPHTLDFMYDFPVVLPEV
jgi:6-phosphofructokinase